MRRPILRRYYAFIKQLGAQIKQDASVYDIDLRECLAIDFTLPVVTPYTCEIVVTTDTGFLVKTKIDAEMVYNTSDKELWTKEFANFVANRLNEERPKYTHVLSLVPPLERNKMNRIVL